MDLPGCPETRSCPWSHCATPCGNDWCLLAACWLYPLPSAFSHDAWQCARLNLRSGRRQQFSRVGHASSKLVQGIGCNDVASSTSGATIAIAAAILLVTPAA